MTDHLGRDGTDRQVASTRTSLAARCFTGILLALLLNCQDPGPRSVSTVLADASGECRISAEQVLQLTGDHVNSGIVRLSPDNIFLEGTSRIAVFDLRGNFKRYLGREGSGPGEFRHIDDIQVLPAGRLAVFESLPPRATVIDTFGTVISVSPLPVLINRGGALALGDSAFVLAGRIVHPSNSGSALVRIGADGTPAGYFGRDEAETTGFGRGQVLPRVIALDSERRLIVAAKAHKYDLELWQLDGYSRAKVFVHRPDWFGEQPVPAGSSDPHRSVGAPQPLIRGLNVDSAGRVWVTAQVAAPDWQRSVLHGTVVDREAWIDTQIEVLDIDTGKSLCTARFLPMSLVGFASEGVIASYREDRNGEPVITLWRLSATRPDS